MRLWYYHLLLNTSLKTTEKVVTHSFLMIIRPPDCNLFSLIFIIHYSLVFSYRSQQVCGFIFFSFAIFPAQKLCPMDNVTKFIQKRMKTKKTLDPEERVCKKKRNQYKIRVCYAKSYIFTGKGRREVFKLY